MSGISQTGSYTSAQSATQNTPYPANNSGYNQPSQNNAMPAKTAQYTNPYGNFMSEIQQNPATAVGMQIGSQALNMGQKYVDQNVIFSYGAELSQLLT